MHAHFKILMKLSNSVNESFLETIKHPENKRHQEVFEQLNLQYRITLSHVCHTVLDDSYVSKVTKF